jgi:hypothetical protein
MAIAANFLTDSFLSLEERQKLYGEWNDEIAKVTELFRKGTPFAIIKSGVSSKFDADEVITYAIGDIISDDNKVDDAQKTIQIMRAKAAKRKG